MPVSFDSPNDSGARVFATLTGIGLAALVVAHMSEIQNFAAQAVTANDQPKAEDTRTAQVTNDTESNAVSNDTAPAVASSARSSAAASVTMEDRVESREGAVNAPADYSASSAADCPRRADGTCIASEADILQIRINEICRGDFFVNGTSRRDRWDHCDIDELATENARNIAREYLRNRPQPTCLDRTGATTTDRARCATPEEIRQFREQQLTLEQEQELLRQIEDRFLKGKKEQDRLSFVAALNTARQRVQNLLQSAVYKFSESNRTELTTRVTWIQKQLTRFNGKTTFTEAELQAARAELVRALQAIQGMVTDQKQQLAQSAPRLENIVTRIDDLVTRVGTVLRELELDGLDVPAEVTEGYLTAKTYLTDAKRLCSMRRPASCRLLGQALDEIAKMREPLCALPSDRLTFCQ